MRQLENLSIGPVAVTMTCTPAMKKHIFSPTDSCHDFPGNMALKCSVTPIKEDAERNFAMKVKKELQSRTTSDNNHDKESPKNNQKGTRSDAAELDCNSTTENTPHLLTNKCVISQSRETPPICERFRPR